MASKRVRCYTRALKNARYLQRSKPADFNTNDVAGFGTGIPLGLLQQVHRLRHDSPRLAKHEAVSRFLERSKSFGRTTSRRPSPLFNGTIHFAHVEFETPAGVRAFSTADMQSMVLYAKQAIVPMARMISGYGVSSVVVSSKLLRHTATLKTHSFSDLELQGWIRQIVETHRLPQDSCVVVPCPRRIFEHSGGIGANSGYHGFARAPGIPYIVLGVHGDNLTLADRSDCYAMGVSHEIAEMIVDPRAHDANPEVCDPCCMNCSEKFYRAYFTAANAYLGTNRRARPSGYRFAYYTAVVVRPAGVATPKHECVATKADCNYRP
jgi:hypothetical protein